MQLSQAHNAAWPVDRYNAPASRVASEGPQTEAIMRITVDTTVNAPVAAVWKAYATPDDIVQWNAASDDWHTTRATVDLRVGGRFSSRMEARDGSFRFDFEGTY